MTAWIQLLCGIAMLAAVGYRFWRWYRVQPRPGDASRRARAPELKQREADAREQDDPFRHGLRLTLMLIVFGMALILAGLADLLR